ncbi:MAG: helix-turn-helix transcriptional regulator [Clostridia bacterium]|nr:helix-turn-helix transcriptional regulator [Clostridia bacterium]
MAEEKRNISQSYYNEDDIRNESKPFLVNCVGEVVLKKKFRTRNPGRNDYYLMYVHGGVMDAEVKGREMLLGAGDVICIPPGTPYGYNNYSCDDVIRYYWLHFTGNDCDRILSECGIPIGRAVKLGESHEAAYYFEDMFAEFRARRTNFEFSVSLKAQYLLLYIGRTLLGEIGGERVVPERSIKYIHTHIKNRITVKELAEMEYLSPSRYREVFREATGRSPMEYVTWQRIHLACELIEQGDISLARVAELCGFSDRLYFQRVFKRIMKITPGEFRRRSGGEDN